MINNRESPEDVSRAFSYGGGEAGGGAWGNNVQKLVSLTRGHLNDASGYP